MGCTRTPVPAIMRRVNPWPARRAQPAPAYLITVIMRARMLTVVMQRVIGRRYVAASARIAPNIVAPVYHRLLCQDTHNRWRRRKRRERADWPIARHRLAPLTARLLARARDRYPRIDICLRDRARREEHLITAVTLALNFKCSRNSSRKKIFFSFQVK